MFRALLAARGVPARSVTRRAVGEAGTESEAIEYAVGRSSRYADLRLTEYVRGGHDAWTRALADPRLHEWWAEGGG